MVTVYQAETIANSLDVTLQHQVHTVGVLQRRDIESFGRPKGGLKLWLVRRATEGVDAVIHHARPQEDFYREYLPALEGKSHFVALGIGLPEKRRSWETAEENFILSWGTAAPGRRDWKLFMDALKIVGDAPPVKIVGASDFPIERAPSVETLPRLSSAELGLLIQQCSLAVLPLSDRQHAHGQLSLLHLMSLGTPVVVSDTSGVRDYVEQGKTALVYKVGDAMDLADKIRWAMEHPDERRAIGRRAYETVRREFDAETFSRRIYDLIKGLVSDTSS